MFEIVISVQDRYCSFLAVNSSSPGTTQKVIGLILAVKFPFAAIVVPAVMLISPLTVSPSTAVILLFFRAVLYHRLVPAAHSPALAGVRATATHAPAVFTNFAFNLISVPASACDTGQFFLADSA